jgi:hypothetical protein
LSDKPYNPLAKRSLAESVVRSILESQVHPLSDTSHLVGAGVYILYYTGSLEWYAPIATLNRDGKFAQPIYIGKAIPKGGRKGGFAEDAAAKGTALRDRLGQHFSSVTEARNLKAADFYYRYLMVDDIWIPLGENMLIEEFKPVWNRVIDGFGNKDPGMRRKNQYRSPWDVIHPGRKFADKLGEHPKTVTEILAELASYFATGAVPKRKNATGDDNDMDNGEGNEEEQS